MSENTAGGATDVGPTVGGVLLAAGSSSRFEHGNKLLAEVDGEPIVRHAARSLLGSSLADVVVIVGYQAEAVRAALEGLDLSFRVNEDYADGQSTSVARGVAVARERGWDAVVFGLGDMPWVEPATVDALLSAYADDVGPVLAPAYEGRRGNPTLFDARYFDALAAVSGDKGGREILEAEGQFLSVDDRGVLRDVDRTEDLDAK